MVKELQRKSMQQLTVEFFDGEAPDVADFQTLTNVFSAEKKANTYYIKVSEDVNDLLKFVTSRHIKRMTLEDSSLEDIFLTYYKDELDLAEEE